MHNHLCGRQQPLVFTNLIFHPIVQGSVCGTFTCRSGVPLVPPQTLLVPRQTVNINVTGYNANSGYIEHVFITNLSGDIVQVLSGTSGSIQSNVCEDFTVYSLNYFDLCLDFPVPLLA